MQSGSDFQHLANQGRSRAVYALAFLVTKALTHLNALPLYISSALEHSDRGLTAHHSGTACRAQGPDRPVSSGSSPAEGLPGLSEDNPERVTTAALADSPTPS